MTFKLNDEQQEALDVIVSCGDWFALKEHIEFLVNQYADSALSSAKCIFCGKEYGNEAELKAHYADLHAGTGSS